MSTKTAVIAALIMGAVATPIIQHWQIAQMKQQLADAQDESRRLSALRQPGLTVDAPARSDQRKIEELQTELVKLRAKLSRPAEQTPNRSPRQDEWQDGTVADSAKGASGQAVPFTIDLTNHIPVGQTLVAGGWSQNPGRRTFLFTTPKIEDQAGKSIVSLESVAVEGTEQFWNEVGWAGLTSDSHQSGPPGELDSLQAKSFISSISTNSSLNIGASPRIKTGDGIQAVLQFGNPDGSQFSLDVTPQISPDGNSVELRLHSFHWSGQSSPAR